VPLGLSPESVEVPRVVTVCPTWGVSPLQGGGHWFESSNAHPRETLGNAGTPSSPKGFRGSSPIPAGTIQHTPIHHKSCGHVDQVWTGHRPRQDCSNVTPQRTAAGTSPSGRPIDRVRSWSIQSLMIRDAELVAGVPPISDSSGGQFGRSLICEAAETLASRLRPHGQAKHDVLPPSKTTVYVPPSLVAGPKCSICQSPLAIGARARTCPQGRSAARIQWVVASIFRCNAPVRRLRRGLDGGDVA
jgi:hypothetical protein